MNSYQIFKKVSFNFFVTFILSCIIFAFLPCSFLHADPWGKDANLAERKGKSLTSATPCKTLLFGPFGEKLIAFHQTVISPADGPRSHFIPSSSQYTLNAMRKYGFFKGVSMGCDRLMRENKDPWIYKLILTADGKIMKYDPVP